MLDEEEKEGDSIDNTGVLCRFKEGACVFDCGLFDGVKRLHHKALVFDEFCGTSFRSFVSWLCLTAEVV